MSLQSPNFVHIDENWRQRVKLEQKKANSFESEWGFMVPHTPPSHLERPHATSPTKYFNPRGGTWTVQEKRVPLFGLSADAKKLPVDDLALKHSTLLEHKNKVPNRYGSPVRYGPPSTRTAKEAALISHSLRNAYIRQSNPTFQTSTSRYGARLPLEMFGVSDHGHKTIRSTQSAK